MSATDHAGLLERIQHSAGLTPEAPAMLHGDSTVRYRDLPPLIQATSQALRQQGIQPGETIGLSMDHTPLHAVALLALLRLGVLVLPLSPALEPELRNRLAQKYGLRRMVADHAGAQVQGLPLILLGGITARHGGAADDSYPPLPATAARLALTSGTSGEPKAVLHTHGELLQRALRSTAGWDGGAQLRLLPPRLHLTVATASLLGTLCCGGTVVFPWGREFEHLVIAAQRHAVTHLLLSPAAALEVAARLPKAGLPGLRQLRLVGGTPTPEQCELLRRRCTPNLLITYALTELGPLALSTPELLAAKPYGSLRVCEDVRLEVVDAQGKAVAPGQLGEIRAMADAMPASYYGEEPHNRLRFRQGWFHTGDLGRLSADGLLRVEGRNDELLNLGGHKILPAVLEQSLLADPQVLQAAVFTAAGADGAERLAAALVTAPGCDTQAVAARCRGLLGIVEPHRLLLLAELPRNELGKVRRGELRRLAETRRP